MRKENLHMSTNENLSFNPLDTDKLCQEDYSLSSCNCCFTPAENNIHSRRCFMTGEYCSKQTIIQRKRQKLHQKKSISAFVVMNFSDMSDVVYKWRIKDYIESLSQYLYLDERNGRLYCSIVPLKSSKNSTKKTIDKIYPIRSDSDPASNYVICSRICQQIQIADLVIVDVSSQNPNVFYELGMAVALGKLILPICYSESYYKMIYPEKLQKRLDKAEKHHIFKDIEHHIGLSPWRKNLFEYYGILYRKWSPTAIKIDQDKAIPLKDCGKTVYIDYDIATSPENGFSDIKYSRFPYHEKIDLPKDKKNDEDYKKRNETLGKTIYNKLAQTYNKASSDDNTLIVYTMEHFLNKEQAGRCIVNFYRNITARMQYEQCFCGDRVGVLVQENVIPENDKDTHEQLNLCYNVGEIIHIGVNQATYLASAKRKQTPDIPLSSSHEKHRIEHYLKTHTTNRGMLAYPNNPVYADRVKNDIDKTILYETGKTEIERCTCTNTDFFCLYHVMLRTLRNTNQIVVDLSNNCLQSLFWLGAAHGSDIHAVTVLHEETEKERKIITGGIEKKTRNIFDVAGLWTAILRSNDTDGFYRQLALAQAGIENHSSIRLFIVRKKKNK